MVVARETVAWHEAGHAVIAAVLGSEIKTVSLNDAIVLERPRHVTVDDGLNGAIIALAGPITEMRRFNYKELERCWASGWSGDLANARQRYAGNLGEAFRRADHLLRRHWRAVERVADALLARGELSGAEVRRLAAV
jgi:ATP-dependent Zn protease